MPVTIGGPSGGGGGGGLSASDLTALGVGDFVRVPLTISTPGQTAFTLTYSPLSTSEVLLELNGVKQTLGTDYSVSGTALTWSGISLETSDVLVATYEKVVDGG